MARRDKCIICMLISVLHLSPAASPLQDGIYTALYGQRTRSAIISVVARSVADE
jgi:hypothetical protein